MNSQLTLLVVLLALGVQTASANDIEKVMNKALGSGKSQLLKQAGNIAKSQILKDKSPATPATAAAGSTAAAKTATPAASGAGAATPALSPAPSTSTPAAATAPGHSSLKDKLMHRAAVESEKYAKKYGNKYLKQGTGSLGKLLD